MQRQEYAWALGSEEHRLESQLCPLLAVTLSKIFIWASVSSSVETQQRTSCLNGKQVHLAFLFPTSTGQEVGSSSIAHCGFGNGDGRKGQKRGKSGRSCGQDIPRMQRILGMPCAVSTNANPLSPRASVKIKKQRYGGGLRKRMWGKRHQWTTGGQVTVARCTGGTIRGQHHWVVMGL